MPFSRYSRAPILRMGEQYGTSSAIRVIRTAVKAGTISIREIEIHEAQRLDTLAGSIYGDAKYWWVLAACSDIGWGLQLPAGTIIKVPELADIAQLVG